MLYTFCIWKDAGNMLIRLLISIGINERYLSFIAIPGNHYYVTLGVIIGLHIVISFMASKVVISKLLRRYGYVPYSEIDAQLLVKYSLAKVGTKCYLSNNKPIKGVQGKIEVKQ